MTDAKFKAQGCSAAIATSSYATEMIIGMISRRARSRRNRSPSAGRTAGIQDALQRPGVRRHTEALKGSK